MRITEIAVRNWRFTLVMFIGVLALGASSLLSMPRGEDPPFHAPYYTVVAIYPGTSAEDMEKLVVKPIEKRLQNLDRLKRVRTETRDGLAVFGVEYEYGVNIDDKFQEVTREISAVRDELPAELASLTVNKASSSDVKIYQWAIVSDTESWRAMKEQADRLKDALSPIKDLKSVDEWAFPNEQVNVTLDLSRMAAGSVPLNRVLAAIQANNANIPGGDVVAGARKMDVKTAGEIKDVDQLRQMVVYTNGTKILKLADIADVNRGYETESYRARLNGRRCVYVTAAMHEGRNIEEVKGQVQKALAGYRPGLPAGFELQTVFDQSKGVEDRLSRFARDFFIAILLVLVTLLPLGSRASLVVMIAIPLSLSIGLTLLNVLGYTINQLSIVGMIVALGILVDDSIVVVENTERWLRNGAGRSGAAIGATRQIAVAVMGCTVLLVLAFMPLMFLPGGSGDFIRSLPMAVVACVLASLLVALTVVPFLSSVILKRHPAPEGTRIHRAFDRLLISGTQRAADAALRRPFVTLGIAFLLFVLSLGLFPVIGQSLFPKSEKPMFLVNIETPAGTNLDETDRIAARVESLLVGSPHVTTVATSIGHDNPQIYYNVAPRDYSENTAQVFVQLDVSTDAVKQSTIQRLRRDTEGIPGAKIEVKEFEQGPPVDAPVAYRIYSEDLAALDVAAAKVEDILRRTPGTIYVDNPLRVKPTDLQVSINRDKAGLLGLSTLEVARDVRLGVAGLDIGRVRTEGSADDLPIHVSLQTPSARPDLTVFDHVWIDTPGGAVIPLGQVATARLDTGITQVRHYDRKRFVAVGAFVESGYNVQRVNQAALASIRSADLGPGVSIEVAGEQESSAESFGGIGLVILVTIFGFIGVLILEFRSFRGILIVMSIIPMGVIGALLMLFFFHESISFTATVGLIALTGIEIKNSLLLVDFANLLRGRGMGVTEAVREAGRMRFLPILLTSLTAIGGLVPLIVEYNPLYSPLAMVLIGGIVSSTIAARFVTPVLYKLLPPKMATAE
ncbi:MAG TPA: efflux RND transporter permease subunit, partial [Spirochaetia bacterium]|nr:efflux RND transporter permease subunit [Spirochaetia bacterium]